MKSVLIASLVTAGVLFAGAAHASPQLAEAACGKCHEMDKKKKGPSYKAAAAKWKGKANAEADMFKLVKDPNGDHPEFKAKDDDTKAVIKWILTL
jgi:cytochrome c